MIRLDRHEHGPRVYVLGVRVHEWHLGAAVLTVTLAGHAAGLWALALWAWIALAAGAWMVAKDWRDLVPSLRDTGAWRLGLHRPFAPLRAIRYADGLPTLAGAVAFAVGIVNLLSALTPNIAWRHHLLLQVLPVRAVPVFHTLAVPGAVALIVCAFPLRARRRRAWQAALVLLVVLGAFDLLKGLDFEEAALTWAAAGFLWWGRDSFVVRPARLDRHSPLWRVGAIGAPLVALAAVAVWLASGRTAEPRGVVGATIDLFAWTKGSAHYGDEFAWLPLAVGLLGLVLLVAGGWAFFRPLRPEPCADSPRTHGEAARLVEEHGSDTLAFFKLRRDIEYLFSGDRRSLVGYRVDAGALLVAGDPVGPPDALPELVRQTADFAESHGLRLAVVGASSALLPLWADAGLSSLYIGDEAIIETPRFSLEGRAIRKVRQAVSRIEAAGYTIRLDLLERLAPAELAELEDVSALWRGGAAERGFSMAMDSLAGEHQAQSLVVIARDGEGRARGFLHLVPAFGRAAVSLSYMRRDRETPNGLTEFMVVRAVELLRERGIEELSLNFAAFGRLLERPSGRIERLLGRLVVLGSRYFQMESLYRFNAKFSPRWEPRYFVYDGPLGLARGGFAALRAEGQLPSLRKARPA